MDASQVAALTAIASLLTGIATLFTLRELRAQRRVQHRPELIVEDVGFRAMRLRHASGNTTLAVAPLDNDGQPAGAPSDELPIQIQNVGRGVARDVTLGWAFDRHAFAAVLAPYEDAIGGRVWIDGKTIELRGKRGIAWYTTGNHQGRLGAILPVPSGQPKSITMDFGYGRLLAAYFAAACSTIGFGEINASPPPDITLELAYRDMEGTRYHKKVIFSFQLVYTTAMRDDDTDDSEAVAQGYFRADDA